jgi:hypothetical protein
MLRYLLENPPHAAFDPDTITILSSALDEAWKCAKTSNDAAFKIDGNAEAARTALAKHIVELATQGQRDRQRLVEGALARLKL